MQQKIADRRRVRSGILFSSFQRGEGDGKRATRRTDSIREFGNFYFYEELTKNCRLTPAELEFLGN